MEYVNLQKKHKEIEFESFPQKQKVTSQVIEKNYDDLTNSNHLKVTSAILPQKVQDSQD